MKYTFEVTTTDMENTIRLNVSYGSLNNNVSRMVTFKAGEDYESQNLDGLLTDIIDNMRLTVKERKEAIYNAGVLKWYIQEYGINKHNEEQLIVEDNIPEISEEDLELK